MTNFYYFLLNDKSESKDMAIGNLQMKLRDQANEDTLIWWA